VLQLVLLLLIQIEAVDEELQTKRRRFFGKGMEVLSGRLVILLWSWSKTNKSQSTSQHKQCSSVHVRFNLQGSSVQDAFAFQCWHCNWCFLFQQYVTCRLKWTLNVLIDPCLHAPVTGPLFTTFYLLGKLRSYKQCYSWNNENLWEKL